MTHSAEFADRFARLTSLLVRQSDDVDDQKQQLMAAVGSANALPVLLTREGDALFADGSPISKSTIYTMVLLDRMKQHSLVRLEVTPGPSPADVLSLARMLAADADGVTSLQQRLAAIRAASLRVETAAPTTSALATPTSHAETPRVALETFEMLSEDQMRSAIARPAPKTTTSTATPSSGMFAEFSGPKAGVTMDQLLQALDDATDIGAVENVLTAFPPHLNAALETDRSPEAVAALLRIARRESRTDDAQTKKMIALAIRRMMTTTVINATIKQLPGAAERLPDFVTVFSHAGDPAIEILADRLAESEQAKERRAIFSVLVQLKSGVPLFIHMLGDRRWFVVRNAADLLAQTGAPEAEEPLIRALDSSDTRARRSVVVALGRYASPKAQGSVRRALQDPTTEVRLAAANSVSRSKNIDMTHALIEVLGREQDVDVQKALIGALGRQGTEPAVKRLVEAAASEMFKRKTPEFRAAAVRALRDVGTPTALQAVKGFAQDKEQVVRDAATKPTK
jgi:HEAT repeat protein